MKYNPVPGGIKRLPIPTPPGGRLHPNKLTSNNTRLPRRECAVEVKHQAQASQALEEKRRARHLRRSLKESGDYLGVQGVNPETGELDIETPTSSSQSAISLHTRQKLSHLNRKIKTAQTAYRAVRDQTQQEVKTLLQESEQHKQARREQDKLAIREVQRRVKWRKDSRQWSSAQEPNLSPITQSQATMTHHSGTLACSHPWRILRI
jgi:hypothetical protein